MAKHYGPKVDKEFRKQRAIMRPGPHNYDVIYVRFDSSRSGDIGQVLQEMLRDKFITRDETNCVSITDAGRNSLRDQNYWK